MHRLLPALLLVAACKPGLGDNQPENQWPDILDRYADYTGDGGAVVGQHIDPFLLPDQTGAEVDQRQFLGFVTVVEIGALWCVPCQDAAATQQALLDALQVDPVWILSVLVQDETAGPPDPADAGAWAQQFGLDLPVLADLLQEQQQAWKITAWPTTLVVAPDGTVLQRWNEATTEAAIREAVAEALSTHAADLRER